jgi:hypothetical protein
MYGGVGGEDRRLSAYPDFRPVQRKIFLLMTPLQCAPCSLGVEHDGNFAVEFGWVMARSGACSWGKSPAGRRGHRPWRADGAMELWSRTRVWRYLRHNTRYKEQLFRLRLRRWEMTAKQHLDNRMARAYDCPVADPG